MRCPESIDLLSTGSAQSQTWFAVAAAPTYMVLSGPLDSATTPLLAEYIRQPLQAEPKDLHRALQYFVVPGSTTSKETAPRPSVKVDTFECALKLVSVALCKSIWIQAPGGGVNAIEKCPLLAVMDQATGAGGTGAPLT